MKKLKINKYVKHLPYYYYDFFFFLLLCGLAIDTRHSISKKDTLLIRNKY